MNSTLDDSNSGNESNDNIDPGAKKKTLIFTTSISKGIRAKRFNDCYKVIGGHAQFARFPGARAKHMASYATPRIEEERPETVIIQGGGNDLPVYGNERTVSLWDIANQIINAG